MGTISSLPLQNENVRFHGWQGANGDRGSSPRERSPDLKLSKVVRTSRAYERIIERPAPRGDSIFRQGGHPQRLH